jgi:lipoate-protein ligase B
MQQELFDNLTAIKLLNRNLPEKEQKPLQNHLFFCEHPHVYTLGKSGEIKLQEKKGRATMYCDSTFNVDFKKYYSGNSIHNK